MKREGKDISRHNRNSTRSVRGQVRKGHRERDVSAYDSKANGRRNTITVTPDNYNGNAAFTVQLGSIYTGTAIRDVQTLKTFGDFTNQTEWSQYAKALNSQLDSAVISPLGINDSIKGKHVIITGAATASGNNVTVTPVAIMIDR